MRRTPRSPGAPRAEPVDLVRRRDHLLAREDRPTATAYPNGPVVVRGDVEILVDGVRVERARRTVALCRCGGSVIKPFCDGTHKATGFCTPEQQTLCRELVEGERVEYEDLTRSFELDDTGLRESA